MDNNNSTVKFAGQVGILSAKWDSHRQRNGTPWGAEPVNAVGCKKGAPHYRVAPPTYQTISGIHMAVTK